MQIFFHCKIICYFCDVVYAATGMRTSLDAYVWTDTAHIIKNNQIS